MAAIFWEEKIFEKLPRVQCSDTLLLENFDEIALSRTVKEIEAILLRYNSLPCGTECFN